MGLVEIQGSVVATAKLYPWDGLGVLRDESMAQFSQW